MTAVVKPDATAPFVTRLRARANTIDLSRPGSASITIRVEVPELWDTVRIVASPSEPVASIKRAAMDALCPSKEHADECVIKLRGWEVLDETASLSDAGAINGSIFLLTHRRRRAVR
jgi:hypothetical protein